MISFQGTGAFCTIKFVMLLRKEVINIKRISQDVPNGFLEELRRSQMERKSIRKPACCPEEAKLEA